MFLSVTWINYDTFSEAYAIFLESGNVPPSLEDDIRRLNEHQLEQDDDDDANEVLLIDT